MTVPSHPAEMRGRFTLMEMLVVVAIIVLLAAMAALIVMGCLDDAKNDKAHVAPKTLADEDAKKDKAHVDCKTLAEQAKMYKLKYGDYPQTLAQLTQPGADGNAPYIEAGLLIDPWGHEYQYAPVGRHPVSDPEVWSMGPRNDPNSIVGSWQ
jgi:prepilin-type N-terminal cleavage/methylation domain-containing protein